MFSSTSGLRSKKGSAWLREVIEDDHPTLPAFRGLILPAEIVPEAVDLPPLFHPSNGAVYDEEEEREPHFPPEDLVVDGLIAHWPMDQEGTSTYVPDVATGTYHGSTAGGATWMPGMLGNALQLFGSQYAQFRNEPNLVGPDHSYTLWLRPSSVTGQRGIISKMSNITGQGLLIEQNGASLRVYLDSQTPQLIKPGVFSVNTWVHVAVVLDMGTVRLYLNGAPDLTASYTTVSNWDGGSFLVGRQNNLQRFFAGLVDDVRVYEVPLSAAEVAAIYDEG